MCDGPILAPLPRLRIPAAPTGPARHNYIFGLRKCQSGVAAGQHTGGPSAADNQRGGRRVVVRPSVSVGLQPQT